MTSSMYLAMSRVLAKNVVRNSFQQQGLLSIKQQPHTHTHTLDTHQCLLGSIAQKHIQYNADLFRQYDYGKRIPSNNRTRPLNVR